MLAKPNRSAVVPILRHRRPSPWANRELSRITIAECFACRIWITANWQCSTASARQPRDGCTSTPSINSSPGTALNPPRIQPDRGRSLPLAPGITRSGRKHHQPTTRSRAPPGSRSRRFRLAESRVSGRNQPSERSQAARVSLWQLVERGAKFRSAQTCLWRQHACQARLCNAGHAVWVWLSQIGVGRLGVG
jgi:hypothetical protein